MNNYLRNTIILFLMLSLCQMQGLAQVRILTIGDSTMANYDEEKYSGDNEMRGWGQMFGSYLKNNVTLDNAAKNGRSSKSFYFELWQDLRDSLKPGDYVFIQFGHNDEKADGQDTDENDITQRGTAAWGQYQKYLTKYIEEARTRGATPILFTPIVRRYFEDNNRITEKGQHNLAEFAAGDNSIMNYPLAMKALAKELSVPLIDATLLTKILVESYGSEKSKETIYCNKDNTHLRENGAKLIAQLMAEGLLSQLILTDYIFVPAEN